MKNNALSARLQLKLLKGSASGILFCKIIAHLLLFSKVWLYFLRAINVCQILTKFRKGYTVPLIFILQSILGRYVHAPGTHMNLCENCIIIHSSYKKRKHRISRKIVFLLLFFNYHTICISFRVFAMLIRSAPTTAFCTHANNPGASFFSPVIEYVLNSNLDSPFFGLLERFLVFYIRKWFPAFKF